MKEVCNETLHVNLSATSRNFVAGSITVPRNKTWTLNPWALILVKLDQRTGIEGQRSTHSLESNERAGRGFSPLALIGGNSNDRRQHFSPQFPCRASDHGSGLPLLNVVDK